MRCGHDFRLMIGELLCVKNNKIALRNLTQDTFNPLKPRNSNSSPKSKKMAHFNQNSSRMLENVEQYKSSQ